jgi:pyruvate/2-oxoglutarate dehydrogenase complex dihydrolipoamide acyltransferase (E2) component
MVTELLLAWSETTRTRQLARFQPSTVRRAAASAADAGRPSENRRFHVVFPPNMTDPSPAATASAEMYGEGLARLLDLVAERMPRAEVAAVWAFPGVRREGREYGVAVIERRLEGERRLVYRGRYVHQLKGQDRGKVIVHLEETAEALPQTLQRVLEGVRQRADEAGDALPVDLAPWRGDDAGR